jgi:hypothetical protein
MERPNTVAGLIAKRDELARYRKALEAGEERVSATIPAHRTDIGLQIEAGLREAIAHAKANKR